MEHYRPIVTTIFATNRGMEGFAIFLALLGFIIKYWIGKRRFNRRTITGSEGFKSYEQMKLIRFTELIGSLVGNVFLIAGILLFLFFIITPNGHHK
jgi:hypothetical protein